MFDRRLSNRTFDMPRRPETGDTRDVDAEGGDG
jgi:hypothetical protein